MTYSFNKNKKMGDYEESKYANKSTLNKTKTNSVYKISPISIIKLYDLSFTLNTNNPLQISSKLNKLI